MKPTLLVTLLLFCLFNFDAHGQSLNMEVETHNKVKEDVASLEHMIAKKTATLETHLQLANAYYLKEDFAKAVTHYEYYLASQDFSIPEFYYRYSKALEWQKDYAKAMEIYNAAEQLNNTILAGSSYEDQNGISSFSYQISEFEANSKASDLAPSFYGDQIVFSSYTADEGIDPWTGKPYKNLYTSVQDRQESQGEEEPFVIDQVKEFSGSTTAFTED